MAGVGTSLPCVQAETYSRITAFQSTGVTEAKSKHISRDVSFGLFPTVSVPVLWKRQWDTPFSVCWI